MKSSAELNKMTTDPQIVIGAMAASTAMLDATPSNPAIPATSQTLTLAPDDVRSLMDAITIIFSNSQSNGVVASIMTVDTDARAIDIDIASSFEFRAETAQKFSDLWKKMVVISNTHREKKSLQDELTSWKKDVYAFSLPGFASLVARQMVCVSEWNKRHLKAQEHGHGHLGDEMETVSRIIADLVRLEGLLTGSALQPVDLQDIIETVEGVNQKSQAITNDLKAHIESFVYPPYKSHKPKHSLFPGIEDITNLPRHVLFLEKFILSKRMESLSSHRLNLKSAVSKLGATDSPWPSSQNEWETICRAIHQINGREYNPQPDLSPDFNRFQPKASSLRVHLELQLASVLAEIICNPGGAVPYNYIAVSQYSCRACVAWVQSHNEINVNNSLILKGCSGSWPDDWRIPSFRNKALEERLTMNVTDQYLAWATIMGNARYLDE